MNAGWKYGGEGQIALEWVNSEVDMLVPEVRFNLGELFFFFFPHKLAAYVLILLFITISLLTPSFGTLHTFKYSYLGQLTPPPLTHARCKSQLYLADL